MEQQSNEAPGFELPATQKVMFVARLRKNKNRRDEVAERWWEVAATNLEMFPPQVRRFIGDTSCQEVVVSEATAKETLKICEAVCRGFSLGSVPCDYEAGMTPSDGCVTYEQERILQTSLLFTDARVLLWGHASSRVACIASSAAVQTFARIAATLGVLAAPIEMDPTEPRIDVQLVEGETSRALIAGVFSSLRGIAQECPGMFLVQDARKLAGITDQAQQRIESIGEQARAHETGSFAATLPGAKAIIRDVDGRPLRARSG